MATNPPPLVGQPILAADIEPGMLTLRGLVLDVSREVLDGDAHKADGYDYVVLSYPDDKQSYLALSAFVYVFGRVPLVTLDTARVNAGFKPTVVLG